jgi:hypothetical protein
VEPPYCRRAPAAPLGRRWKKKRGRGAGGRRRRRELPWPPALVWPHGRRPAVGSFFLVATALDDLSSCMHARVGPAGNEAR